MKILFIGPWVSIVTMQGTRRFFLRMRGTWRSRFLAFSKKNRRVPCIGIVNQQASGEGNLRIMTPQGTPWAFLDLPEVGEPSGPPRGPPGHFQQLRRRFLSRRLILLLQVQYGLSVRPLGHPEGPRGVFSSCRAQFLSWQLFLLLRVQKGLSVRPLSLPKGPRGVFSSCLAQFLPRRPILLLRVKCMQDKVIKTCLNFIKPPWSNGYESGLSPRRSRFDSQSELFPFILQFLFIIGDRLLSDF